MRVTLMTMRVMCHYKMRATCLGGRGPYNKYKCESHGAKL